MKETSNVKSLIFIGFHSFRVGTQQGGLMTHNPKHDVSYRSRGLGSVRYF
jgi:hypothetical protein